MGWCGWRGSLSRCCQPSQINYSRRLPPPLRPVMCPGALRWIVAEQSDPRLGQKHRKNLRAPSIQNYGAVTPVPGSLSASFDASRVLFGGARCFRLGFPSGSQRIRGQSSICLHAGHWAQWWCSHARPPETHPRTCSCRTPLALDAPNLGACSEKRLPRLILIWERSLG